MTSRIPILIAASALAGCAQTPRSEAPAQASNPLKVATWNLEHLAENDGTGCRPRSEADYAELRHQADLLNADVIAIEAVESKAAAERVFEPSRYDVVMSARRVSGRSGACYGKPGQSIRHQAVGFAIRKGVSWSRNRDLSALGLGNPDLRWGVDITINGARPLRLLAVHLKSGCNSGRAPSDDDCTVLFNQLPVLESWIDARAQAGEAFAVLGDWNRRIASRGDVFLGEIDDGEPTGADLTVAAGDTVATCKSRYREFIDHIVTGDSATTMMVPGSFEEYTYGLPEDRHPSDHCPVSVLFAI